MPNSAGMQAPCNRGAALRSGATPASDEEEEEARRCLAEELGRLKVLGAAEVRIAAPTAFKRVQFESLAPSFGVGTPPFRVVGFSAQPTTPVTTRRDPPNPPAPPPPLREPTSHLRRRRGAHRGFEGGDVTACRLQSLPPVPAKSA